MTPLSSLSFWTLDWVWGVPLVAFTMVVHALGLTLGAFWLNRVFDMLPARRRSHRFVIGFSIATALAGTFLSALHAVEVFIWAAAYLFLGALHTAREAVLYSMGMMTTTGANDLELTAGWRLMGRLEGMAGMLLFGLSTAFLFTVFSRAWPAPHRHAGKQIQETDHGH